jgi:small GTP-binding protein
MRWKRSSARSSSKVASSRPRRWWSACSASVIQGHDAESWSKDAKTELQEWLQARRIAVPAYRITATRGQAHAQTFDVECAVPALGLAEHGEGRSRRTAEQEAARRCWTCSRPATTRQPTDKIMNCDDDNDPPAPQAPQRCGLVAIVGRPNVGKSTLLNALVGQKISITSNKAQTTRHRITGIRTVEVAQFVFVDTPGFQVKHTAALNRTLNRTVLSSLGDVDVVLFVVEAGALAWPDAKVLALLKSEAMQGKPVLLVANKLDEMPRRHDVLPWLQQMQARHTALPSSCPCRPRARPMSSACWASCSPTCPSSPGCTKKTRSPTAANVSWPAS